MQSALLWERALLYQSEDSIRARLRRNQNPIARPTRLSPAATTIAAIHVHNGAEYRLPDMTISWAVAGNSQNTQPAAAIANPSHRRIR